jgi:hypothetical protein
MLDSANDDLRLCRTDQPNVFPIWTALGEPHPYLRRWLAVRCALLHPPLT